MITWMQRHKKWLIITIWISTIAFIGAGFVGWGQYSYGDKATAVAKVGTIEISRSELQKSYSRLYQQYNQMLQGNFDEEEAKALGLQRQALQQLIQQALLLNLANAYDLIVSDKELFDVIKAQKVFYTNGAFDKNLYKQILSQNRMTPKEYESGLRKELLIQKTLKLLPVQTSDNERKIATTLFSIADTFKYKILTADSIKITYNDADLKAFWSTMKNNFMSEVAYEIAVVKVAPIKQKYDDAAIAKYYAEHKRDFTGKDGKIQTLQDAKPAVIEALNNKASKDHALRQYIALKKGKIDPSKKENYTISQSNNPLGDAVFQKVITLSLTKPYAKPVAVNGSYYIIELIKIHPAVAKTFATAKAEVLPLYLKEKRKEKLLELANRLLPTFNGKTADLVTVSSVEKIPELTKEEAAKFLQQLFTSDKKQSFIVIDDQKIILYDILEQKLLQNSDANKASDLVTQLKSTIFSEGLLETLQKRYKTEIFIQGL